MKACHHRTPLKLSLLARPLALTTLATCSHRQPWNRIPAPSTHSTRNDLSLHLQRYLTPFTIIKNHSNIISRIYIRLRLLRSPTRRLRRRPSHSTSRQYSRDICSSAVPTLSTLTLDLQTQTMASNPRVESRTRARWILPKTP